MVMDALALVFVVMAVLDWFIAILLVRASGRHPDWPALSERAAAAVLIATVASLAAFAGLTRTGLFDLPRGSGWPLIAFGLLLMSLSSAAWLVMYVRGSFWGEG